MLTHARNPPFPATSGVWGKPTCVNNVETLCNVPAILANGVEWYQNISKSKDAGTKLMGFSGRVKKSGSVGTAVWYYRARDPRRLRRWYA